MIRILRYNNELSQFNLILKASNTIILKLVSYSIQIEAENESTKSNRLELFETYTVKITNKITPTVRIASNVHAAYQSYLY